MGVKAEIEKAPAATKFCEEQKLNRFHALLILLGMITLIFDGYYSQVIACILPDMVKDWHFRRSMHPLRCPGLLLPHQCEGCNSRECREETGCFFGNKINGSGIAGDRRMLLEKSGRSPIRIFCCQYG